MVESSPPINSTSGTETPFSRLEIYEPHHPSVFSSNQETGQRNLSTPLSGPTTLLLHAAKETAYRSCSFFRRNCDLTADKWWLEMCISALIGEHRTGHYRLLRFLEDSLARTESYWKHNSVCSDIRGWQGKWQFAFPGIRYTQSSRHGPNTTRWLMTWGTNLDVEKKATNRASKRSANWDLIFSTEARS